MNILIEMLRSNIKIEPEDDNYHYCSVPNLIYPEIKQEIYIKSEPNTFCDTINEIVDEIEIEEITEQIEEEEDRKEFQLFDLCTESQQPLLSYQQNHQGRLQLYKVRIKS